MVAYERLASSPGNRDGSLTTGNHIEQAFSTDGGKDWGTNWISDFTKVAG